MVVHLQIANVTTTSKQAMRNPKQQAEQSCHYAHSLDCNLETPNTKALHTRLLTSYWLLTRVAMTPNLAAQPHAPCPPDPAVIMRSVSIALIVLFIALSCPISAL